MGLSESLLVSIFCISVVFIVLISLFLIIRILSAIFANEKSSETIQNPVAEINIEKENNDSQVLEEEIFSSGILKLKGVDEKTAAMIMAIVSDESGIPLSELCFKSIRLIQEN